MKAPVFSPESLGLSSQKPNEPIQRKLIAAVFAIKSVKVSWGFSAKGCFLFKCYVKQNSPILPLLLRKQKKESPHGERRNTICRCLSLLQLRLHVAFI